MNELKDKHVRRTLRWNDYLFSEARRLQVFGLLNALNLRKVASKESARGSMSIVTQGVGCGRTQSPCLTRDSVLPRSSPGPRISRSKVCAAGVPAPLSTRSDEGVTKRCIDVVLTGLTLDRSETSPRFASLNLVFHTSGNHRASTLRSDYNHRLASCL
jgi:hypothetical protein